MPSFIYRARDSGGKVVQGTIVADSEREVLTQLDRQGLFPFDLRSEAAGEKVSHKVARRIRHADVITLSRELSDLLRAGIPIDRSLQLISEHTPNARLAEIVESLQRDLSKGRPFHEALAAHPKLFPPFYVSMVRAAEMGGFLEDTLERIALFSEKDEELRSRIRTALAYPTLLSVVGTAAVVFLLVFFIPRFSEIFEQFGAALPWLTQALIDLSLFLRDYSLVLAAVLAAAGAGVYLWLRTPAGEWKLARLQLRLPVLGPLVLRRALARFSRTLGTMLSSGVPILTALGIAKESMGNAVLMREIDEASMAVKRGEKLGRALGRSRWIPPMLSSRILVGEESGSLDQVLVQASDSYDREVDRAVRVFVSLFEPLLLVLMAGLVGVVVIAMLLPVFTLSSIVK